MERLRRLPLLPPPPPLPPLLPAMFNFIPPPPPPPPVQLPRFEELMFRQENGPYFGTDIYGRLCTHPMTFWSMTGETIESFNHIVEDIRPLAETGHPHLISFENRVLMAFFWLKKYPDLETLSTIFDVSSRTASRNVHHMIDVLWQYVQNGITWLNDEEWLALRGRWTSIPNAVGAIDGTVHVIEMPEMDHHLYYSGHVHRYCISTQLVIDNQNNIRYLYVSACSDLIASYTCRNFDK